MVKITAAGTYNLSGTLFGQIYVDAGDDDEIELDLENVSIECSYNSPIYVNNASEVKIKAVKKTTNVITDARPTKTEDDESQGEGAIYSACDLKFTGSGTLNVSGSYNNGIHGKDDVSLKNQTLTVTAPHHAVKGNDSISIEEGGTFVFIAKAGDGLHTENSDISSKGNQRGDITITAGEISIYSATDGIDAAHDVIIQDGLDDDNNVTTPDIKIYTNKYSSYTDTTAYAYDTSTSTMYLRTTASYSSSYRYAVYFYNDSFEDGVWSNATYLTSIQSGGGRTRTTYYYYSLDLPSGYSSYRVYRFASSSENSTSSYVAASSGGTLNANYDTVTISVSGTRISASGWSNYSTASGGGYSGGMGPGMGMGGFDQGNTDKADDSAKGIKADNAIIVSSGTIYAKAYDDGLHANYGNALENGSVGVGDITISGGTLTIEASDDGIHADRYLSISGGTLNVKGYEGLEGNQITISGGQSYVYGSDDGVNATNGPLSETYFKMSDGYAFVEVSSNGDVDGIDSNGNIYVQGGTLMSAGPNSGMASALDYEGTCSVSGGSLILFGAPERAPSKGSGIVTSTKSSSVSAGKTYTVTLGSSSLQTGTFAYNHSGTFYAYSSLGSLISIS